MQDLWIPVSIDNYVSLFFFRLRGANFIGGNQTGREETKEGSQSEPRRRTMALLSDLS